MFAKKYLFSFSSIGASVLSFTVLAGRAQAAENGALLEKGKALISELGCIVCHEIKDHQTTMKQEAPGLSYQGEMVRRDWLFAFLKEPYRIRPAVKGHMPNFRLSDREALAITEFLGSLTEPGEPPPKELRYPRKGTPQDVEAAKKLMSKDYFDCFSCHVFGAQKPKGKPEDWAPDLTRIRNRFNPDFFLKWFQTPDKYRPGTKMPGFFPDQNSGPDDILGGDEKLQAAALRDYLMSVGRAESFPAHAKVKAKYPDVTAMEGRTLVKSLNCAGCHEIAVLPEGKWVGPRLTYEGSRVQKEWLLNFLRSPSTIKPEYRLMGAATRMPTFRFNEADLKAVVEYINHVLVDKEADQDSAVDPALAKKGQRLFKEKRCDNCHRIESKAGGIGPDLTEAGKRLRPGWTVRFIQSPAHYLNTRMPNLQISPDEAKALAAYVLGPKS